MMMTAGSHDHAACHSLCRHDQAHKLPQQGLTSGASAAGCWPPGILCITAACLAAAGDSAKELRGCAKSSSASGADCLASRGTTFARVCASTASRLRKPWKPCRASIAFFFDSVSRVDACVAGSHGVVPSSTGSGTSPFQQQAAAPDRSWQNTVVQASLPRSVPVQPHADVYARLWQVRGVDAAHSYQTSYGPACRL